MKSTKNIPKSFIVFLILSILIWLLITLSKEYISQISLNVSYDELPQDKQFRKPPEKELQIIAKGTGFKLLSNRFFNHNIQLKTNKLLKKTNKKYFFLASSQKNNIQKQLVSGLQLDDFLKDTIYLEIGEFASKKVPVISSLIINYSSGFDALKPIKIIPDSIVVSGPEDQINEINSLTFLTESLENVDANFSKKFKILDSKKLKNINYTTKEVLVNGFVEKYTEGSLMKSFTVNGLPKNINLTLFPKQVKVFYKVDLPRFNEVEESSFNIICDYNISVKNGFSYLIPKIILQPEFVKNVKIIPNKIEYLIQK